ncbi:MAG: hypothetical protein ACKD6O_08310 [Candidatus Bathyarchaeota archaeon]
MVKFEVVEGKKGKHDRLVKIWAYGEPFSIQDLLTLLDILFKSEDSCYPISEGKQGRAMLLKAIVDVACGIPLSRVLEAYGLSRKAPKTQVINVERGQGL